MANRKGGGTWPPQVLLFGRSALWSDGATRRAEPAAEGTLAQIVVKQVAQTDKEHKMLLQLQESGGRRTILHYC
jgi:hypothetical protein